ncbi:MAG: FHA domain-containing protein [Gemmataceae bacterium]
MQVNLVVSTGIHQGKQIPIPGDQFIIGRDPTCQLRPASQMVSKQHCAFVIKDEKVFLKDFGSTNGTFVNDNQLVPNSTVQIRPGDRVKVGPLDFTVQFVGGKASDSTPLPEQLQAVSPAASKLAAAAGANKPSSTSVAAATKAPASAPAASTKLSSSSPAIKSAAAADGHDDIAAMLLNMDDDSPATVPDGSTIMEMPAVLAEATAQDGNTTADKKKAAIPSREDSSNAASDILKKMMRRPR